MSEARRGFVPVFESQEHMPALALKIYFFLVTAVLFLILGIELWPEKALVSFATELATEIGALKK